MQVALAVGQPLEDRLWSVFAYTCRGFAIFAIIYVAFIVAFLLSMLVSRSLRETIYALRDRYLRQGANKVGIVA